MYLRIYGYNQDQSKLVSIVSELDLKAYPSDSPNHHLLFLIFTISIAGTTMWSSIKLQSRLDR